ncbi:heavy metal translocating P-type ATPase [Glaciibacter psychrotolerans]|uniref:Heavy metal translocating P-type ATPase n=1 Tax=Glaciibacter psychrotolerans TaxID=670054 RepID=A0A7Z0EIT3_9MICO|nr:heavy metal translocating P-type ATPase [Leifsonia psychrotolerans]NYJ21647.1 heavy metal translocating P-type ATPase [Leifsonia psychrotolerans]
MPSVPSLLRRYPFVTATLVVAVVGLVLWTSGATTQVGWLFGGYALVIAAVQLVGMVKDLRSGNWGIDILAITAIVATVVVGEYVASILIVLMLTGGEALEDFAANRATRELNALLTRAPQIAHRLADAGDNAEDIAATSVMIGDLLLVRPAEIVPVDGALVSPEASFDESSLTGESIPVTKQAGDAVMSGAINGSAAVTVRATATAKNSQYQRIVALVTEASASKAPVVRLADRYAVPFTIVSLLIAGVAWLVSGNPVRFAEVLVLATPCPLLIAAPVAFLGGMSRAARNGVIVKGGGVLETLARARTVVFDKTGTLTTGTPAISAVNPAPPFGADEVLALAASAEQYSSHVLAASVMRAARDAGLNLVAADSASEVATFGVLARFGTREVAVGKLSFIASHAPEAAAAELVGGELAIYIAIDGRFAGSIIARDSVRSNAKATIAALAALGVKRNLILTGDAQTTADQVADALGVTEVHADCLPGDKVDLVRGIAERPVIMVGDGVNDAPVLAVADVGIAMGAKGSTAASESADVVILVDDISRTARAVAIGHDTVRVALQSIWLGIALSVGLMLVAAFGFIPATAGALLQEVVDLAAILNALRAIGGRRDAHVQRVPAPTRAGTPDVAVG